MTQYVWTVMTNPVKGREDEYNRWYNDIHLPDLLRVPGIVSAQRFKLAPVQVEGTSGGLGAVKLDPANFKHRYMAIYNIETNDIDGFFAELLRRAGTPDMALSEALDLDALTTCYEAVAPLAKR